jgi:hypothetical protein
MQWLSPKEPNKPSEDNPLRPKPELDTQHGSVFLGGTLHTEYLGVKSGRRESNSLLPGPKPGVVPIHYTPLRRSTSTLRLGAILL